MATDTLTRADLETVTCETVLGLLEQRQRLLDLAHNYDLPDAQICRYERELEEFDRQHPLLRKIGEWWQ